VDELLQYGEFAAVKIVGDDFNTGLFVAEPNDGTLREMLEMLATPGAVPPTHRGEQGFLNWFFQYRPEAQRLANGTAMTYAISTRYNTIIRFKDYAVWPLLRRSAKVFHFHRQLAPWNFFQQARHDEWEQNFEATVFSYWHQIHLQAVQSLGIEEFAPAELATWPNWKRTLEMCSSMASMYNPNRFAILHKFSVIIGTWDRVALLRKLVLHYQKSRLVHKIYVTWHNPGERPPDDFLRTVRRRPPVEILIQKYNSLNNRFNPIANLETKAVLIADDDIRVGLADLEYGFEVWRQHPHALVGNYPRLHYWNASTHSYDYLTHSPDTPRNYSIMLTKFMFMHSEYLFDYTCLLPLRIHRHIDALNNCEDIAMNILVSGKTGKRPVAVLLPSEDFGTTSGIGVKGGHLEARSRCLTDLIALFGRNTLHYNRQVFIPFSRGRRIS
jgi:glycogenin glucosyltransferase